ncbi:MAG: hypothetical protein OXB90_06905 [Acidimicrobiaceae bacterium]|nr:hypothetical protein [Acidimicrobiaceae bacterium]
MAVFGSDPGDLRRMAARLEVEASRIESAVQVIGQRVECIWWQGVDADRFRGDWEVSHLVRLRRLCERLRQAAVECRGHAVAQERTSGV